MTWPPLRCLVLLLVVPVLLLGATTLWAQEAEEQPAAEPPALTASEVYRDVQVLRIVDTLQLSRAQVQKILPVVEKVAEQAAEDEKADARAFTEVANAGKVVVAALTRGQEPPAREMTALDQAAGERNAREAFRAGLAADAGGQIQRMLTAEQAARIETAAEQAERRALLSRLQGAATPLDYVMTMLEEQMELMPDEYLQVREDRAIEMAQALLGPDAVGVRGVAVTLLGVMDDVAALTPEQYAQALPTLRQDVARALDLSDQVATGLIYYEDFIGWITSDRTLAVLTALLEARAEPEEGQP